jgi:hypothetical protein
MPCNTESCACAHIECSLSKHPLDAATLPQRVRVIHHAEKETGMGHCIVGPCAKSHIQHHCKYDFSVDDCVCKCFDSRHFAFHAASSAFHRTVDSMAGEAPQSLKRLQDLARQHRDAAARDVDGVVIGADAV